MDTPRSSPSIPQFYAGRAVFVTGGSGFMGKVLVARLLTTCPDIGPIHLLMREKKGLTPEQRLVALKDSPVFNVLSATQPKQLEKLALVPGDVSMPLLGLSQESLLQLEEVSLVFHSAATVRFHEDLKVAVDQNLMSVIRLMDVCDALPNVKALVHVSTAYSNSERSYVEETIYPTSMALQELLDYVNNTKDITEEDTLRLISPKPNTYTLAETALAQRASSRYPVSIFRPTIVVSSLQHPFPGWVENHNGPTGLIVGGALGLLRVAWARTGAVGDMLPVDIAIDSLIAVGWETAIDKLGDVRVYNCTTQGNPCHWGEFQEVVNSCFVRYPTGAALWYPHLVTVHNPLLFKVSEFLLQTVPLNVAARAARAARLLCLEPRLDLMRASERLRQMNRALSYFSRREWRFAEGNAVRLRQRLCEQDRAMYNLEPATIDWRKHLIDFVKGTRKYILKEEDENSENARRRMQRLYYRHNILQFVLVSTLGASLFFLFY